MTSTITTTASLDVDSGRVLDAHPTYHLDGELSATSGSSVFHLEHTHQRTPINVAAVLVLLLEALKDGLLLATMLHPFVLAILFLLRHRFRCSCFLADTLITAAGFSSAMDGDELGNGIGIRNLPHAVSKIGRLVLIAAFFIIPGSMNVLFRCVSCVSCVFYVFYVFDLFARVAAAATVGAAANLVITTCTLVCRVAR